MAWYISWTLTKREGKKLMRRLTNDSELARQVAQFLRKVMNETTKQLEAEEEDET